MRTSALVKRRPDLVGVLEALYTPEPDFARWMKEVLAAIAATLVSELDLGVTVVGHEADYVNPLVFGHVAPPPMMAIVAPGKAMLEGLSPATFRAAFYPGRPLVTHRELEPVVSAEAAAMLRSYRQPLGWHDALGLFAYPEPGIAVVLFAGLDRGQGPTAFDRDVFHRIAGHLDTSARLHTNPELAVAAVLAPDGSLRDLSERSLARERCRWFGARVAMIDASRTRRGRASLDPWWALFDGRYSIVPVEERGGKRHYLLVINSPSTERHARFTPREIDVVRMAARGFSGKSISYNLGISSALVSETLRDAAVKVGLRSRHDLIAVAAALFGAGSQTVGLETLTAAERQVLELLRRGLSNEEIARRRERSPNTIKNQIASMLRKTQSPSRRALALTTLPKQ